MYVLLTGGTGFIGSHLIPKLLYKGLRPLILTRNPRKFKKRYGSKCRLIQDLSQIEPDLKIMGMINLAGAPIDKRWSKRYKRKLLASRIETTQALIALIERLETKPKWLISGSAIGYYGSQNDDILTEDSTVVAGFTHDLCAAWEQEALKAQQLGLRVCLIRTGVVLGKGGALKRMLPAFKFGLGGRLGSGKQWFSWIAMEDIVRVILYAIKVPELSGPINATAPHPVRNLELTKALAKTVKRPAIFPMPAWVVKLLFGEMGQTLLLEGQKVIPQKLLEHGFEFKYPHLEPALIDAIRGKHEKI